MTDLAELYRNRILEMTKWGHLLPISELSKDEVQNLREALSAKFTLNRLIDVWSLDFMGEMGVYDANAWRWTHEFIADKKIILLVRVGMEMIGFEFADGVRAIQAVDHLHLHSDFYFTNPENSFLCYQHHEEALVLAGEITDWFKQKQSVIYDLLGLPPKPIIVKDLIIGQWGSEVILECIYDFADEKQTFRLIFKNTWIRDLRSRAKQSDAQVQHIIFDKLGYGKMERVYILTQAFRLHLDYLDLIVERTEL